MRLWAERRLKHLGNRDFRPTAARAVSGRVPAPGWEQRRGARDGGNGDEAARRWRGEDGLGLGRGGGVRPGATGGKGTGGGGGRLGPAETAAAAGKINKGGAGRKLGLKAKESDKEKEKNIKSRENEKITPPKGEEGRGRLLRRGWGRQE